MEETINKDAHVSMQEEVSVSSLGLPQPDFKIYMCSISQHEATIFFKYKMSKIQSNELSSQYPDPFSLFTLFFFSIKYASVTQISTTGLVDRGKMSF